MKAWDIVVGPWGARFMGRRFACSIGRGGVVPSAKKREGDGGTPTGTHKIVGMLYRPDRMVKPADWAVPIGLGDFWSEDPDDPDYNQMVQTPHRFGHECLRRADLLYDLILITDWNWPYAPPGKGSAIFIHAWRKPRHPTAGCVGFARADLAWIAPRIKHSTRLIIRG
ncbi:MAG: L,D-transpeptidase family protein [Rhodoferax sp.]|nr:L,D-transpeptidase family protein [Pseudorhodobacter sp.]